MWDYSKWDVVCNVYIYYLCNARIKSLESTVLGNTLLQVRYMTPLLISFYIRNEHAVMILKVVVEM